MSVNDNQVHINVTFRNIEPTDALKGYATDKFTNALKKFAHQNVEASVVLRVEKNRQTAEITFRTDNKDFTGSETNDDMYASIDKLVDSITKQLRRHKEKLESSRRR